MLGVPTLWIVFVVNFCAIGLIWAYVARSYPNLEAARFWTAASLVAGAAALIPILYGLIEPPEAVRLVPFIVSGGMIVLAGCLAAMGIERFYGRPLRSRVYGLITGLSVLGLTYFAVVQDDMPVRVSIYSIGQSLPLVVTLPLLFSRRRGVVNAGASLAGFIAVLMIIVYAARSIGAFLNVGGGVSMVHLNTFQVVLALALIFLSMMWNFGFLLMAIDRLRMEVADLALFDDLTGAANRRHLLSRLDQECARSDRSLQAFTVLVIDLDGFKDINDTLGHAAGDECLRVFTRLMQARLRIGDFFARMGGDEFCVVLPATTLREGAVVARHVLDCCRAERVQWNGNLIRFSVSIGAAQWRAGKVRLPDELIAAADSALYVAKKEGKDRTVLHDGPEPIEPLRKIA